jgi:four helix bundle protein
MAKGDDIEERLIEFGVRIVKLCDSVPLTRGGDHLANQLLRSGTSPAAHYAEGRGAESRKDFIHKLKLCVKELNESKVWLKIIRGSELLPASRMNGIIQECIELSRIINASITTARSKLDDN